MTALVSSNAVWDLGDVLSALRAVPSAAVFAAGAGLDPSALGSARADYACLAVHVGGSCTAGELAAALEAKVGGQIYGYKGGTYTVRRDQPLYVVTEDRDVGARVVGVDFLRGRDGQELVDLVLEVDELFCDYDDVHDVEAERRADGRCDR